MYKWTNIQRHEPHTEEFNLKTQEKRRACESHILNLTPSSKKKKKWDNCTIIKGVCET